MDYWEPHWADRDDPAQTVAPGVTRRTVLRGVALASVVAGVSMTSAGCGGSEEASASVSKSVSKATLGGVPLLCEPYLLDPSEHGVRVVWCTAGKGVRQVVLVGAAVATMTEEQALVAATGKADSSNRSAKKNSWRRFEASSRCFSQLREDTASAIPNKPSSGVVDREVWQHLAEVKQISGGRRPYRIVSIDDADKATVTTAYTLRPALGNADHARLLLTSDHQLKPMTAANLQAVSQTVGVELDGVLMAGDCVNVPDRGSEWFDDAGGASFFATFTGRASKTVNNRTYQGAPILQHTPIFPAIGNHEVMGRWSTTALLKAQFEDPQPLNVATSRWESDRPGPDPRDTWITQHSWNTTTYEQMFPLSHSDDGGQRWYSRRIGDVFLVSLFVAQIWRNPAAAAEAKGRFHEAPGAVNDENQWGYGDFIFEPIDKGSPQYAWLERELRSKQARSAKYRMVMFHRPSHGLGWNSSPPFADPVQAKTVDAAGKVTAVTYSYQLAEDQVLRDVEPLLNSCGVHLVFNGHSHIWNRFRNAAGLHWLETSNVSETLGAFHPLSGRSRPGPTSADLVAQGDPGGLDPIMPTKPLTDSAGKPLPYVASSTITVFSVLDSGSGTVRSYRYDTASAQPAVELFDEFSLTS